MGVLVSGRGSNLRALIDACAAADFPAEIALVLSNKPDAAALEHAASAGLPTAVVDHRDFPGDKQRFEEAMDEALRGAGVQLVCLAGFMRLLSPWFVDAWHDRMINIHPSLLPSFKGLDTHKRAIEAGVRFHGCTVHYVRLEMDEGPIVAQAAVPVLPDDDADSLAGRVLEAEHRLYPLAIRLIGEGRTRIRDGRVLVDGPLPAPPPVTNPAC